MVRAQKETYLILLCLRPDTIYAIQLTELTAKSIWFITPLGGLFFILGWAFMFTGFLKKMRNK
jgi:uncharacterized membrane protein YgdD (TMEM256/DUF423 family)